MRLDVAYPVCHHVTVGENGDCGWCVWERAVVKAHGFTFCGLMSVQLPLMVVKQSDSVRP